MIEEKGIPRLIVSKEPGIIFLIDKEAGTYSVSNRFTLKNSRGGHRDLTYEVTSQNDWITISNGSGVLRYNSIPTPVDIIINQKVAALGNGTHSATIEFVNQDSGLGNTKKIVSIQIGALSSK